MFLFRNKEFQILHHKQYESQRLTHQSYLFINKVSVSQSFSNVNEKHDDKKKHLQSWLRVTVLVFHCLDKEWAPCVSLEKILLCDDLNFFLLLFDLQHFTDFSSVIILFNWQCFAVDPLNLSTSGVYRKITHTLQKICIWTLKFCLSNYDLSLETGCWGVKICIVLNAISVVPELFHFSFKLSCWFAMILVGLCF